MTQKKLLKCAMQFLFLRHLFFVIVTFNIFLFYRLNKLTVL